MNADTATVAPVAMVVEFRFRSAPDVPTEPSATRSPVDFVRENQIAVPPVAAATEPIAFAVMTPAAALPKALVVGKVSVARMTFAAVVAAETSAGWTPA